MAATSIPEDLAFAIMDQAVRTYESQRWRDYPAEPLPQPVEGGDARAAAFWASKIKSGRYVPPSAINPALANCMLKNGLVTADQMRRAGLAP